MSCAAAPKVNPLPFPSPPLFPSAALHSALRLPRASPKVASWLFPDDSESPYIDTSTLPPSLFERALTLVSESYFTPFHTAPPSVAAALPKESYFLVLIPLHIDDSVTLGYTFHIGLPASDSLFPISDVLPSKFALVGRFAYDRSAGQLLIFIKDFTHNYSHLGLCERTPSNDRKLQFVSLAKQRFSAEHLPTEALGVTLMSQPVDEPAGNPDICLDANRECRGSDDDNESGRSSNGRSCPSDRKEVPLTIRQETDCTVVASRPRRGRSSGRNGLQGSTSTTAPASGSGSGSVPAAPVMLGNLTSGANSGGEAVWGTLSRSVAELSAFMSGQFRECPITVHKPDERCGRSAMAVGVFRSYTRHGYEGEAEMLQKMAARTYYASALSVSTDMRLAAGVMGHEEDDEMGMMLR